MFVICTDLIFGFIGLLSAQVCSIKAGLMAGNVAVADETGDAWWGRYLRPCLRAVGIAVVDALKFRRVLFHELCGVGQNFVVIEEVTAV